MELFDREPVNNLLPYDGNVAYIGKILTTAQANDYFDNLLQEIDWKNDETFLFGKRHITKRKVAWYADQPFQYTYSNVTKIALPWTRTLFTLKQLTEQYAGTGFNSCLLNLYHSGEEGMSWHSDDEKTLAPHGTIASLSLGEARKFSFRHKSVGETISLMLEHGSLLLMKDSTQEYWLHSLPKTKKVTTPRINLTFRSFIG